MSILAAAILCNGDNHTIELSVVKTDDYPSVSRGTLFFFYMVNGNGFDSNLMDLAYI